MDDTYKTIEKSSQGLFKDKGSKFLSFAYPFQNENDLKEILIAVKKEHHSARHHCYAYKIGLLGNNFRVNDDGEPTGTAGRPIYGQIESNGLSDVLIIVVRYFGGILLGTSALINAYKNAADNCIANAEIITRVIGKQFQLKFNYELMNQAMRLVKQTNVQVVKQKFEQQCEMLLSVKQSRFQEVYKKFEQVYGLEIQKH